MSVPLSAWITGRRGLVAGAIVLLALVGAVVAPLLTYGTTLALFGPAHVASELRYVERRFGWVLQGSVGVGILVLLVGAAAARAGRVSELLPGDDSLSAELAIVAALAVVLVFRFASDGARAAVGGVVTGAAVGAGIAFDPAVTIVVLACLHNWTPVGFLFEATRGEERRLAGTLCLVVFVALPLLVASGAPWAVASSLGIGAPELSWLAPGPLRSHYGTYLPRAARDADWAQQVFSAVVFAQCLHYLAVIGVMPGLADGGGSGPRLLSRLSDRRFLVLLGIGGLAVFVAFALDFKEARAWYGVPAAVHAWVEVPVLLAALLGRRNVSAA